MGHKLKVLSVQTTKKGARLFGPLFHCLRSRRRIRREGENSPGVPERRTLWEPCANLIGARCMHFLGGAE